jgi:hypothetical protein
MDVFDPKAWKDGLEVTVNNFHIVGPLLVGAGVAGYWFKGTTSEGAIRTLQGELKVVEAQRRLAEESERRILATSEELKAQVKTLTSQIKGGASREVINSTTATIDSTISQLTADTVARELPVEPVRLIGSIIYRAGRYVFKRWQERTRDADHQERSGT